MKKLIVSMVSVTMAIACSAIVIDGWDFDKPDTLERLSKLSRKEVDALSPDVRREYFKRASELHSGGIVEKPGAGAGTFLIADATGRLTEGMFARDFSILDRTLRLRPKLVKIAKPVTAETATATLEQMKGDAAVFVVESATLPRLITASEEGWAIVNVAKMTEGAPSKELMEKRMSVEVIRGLAQIFGSGNAGLSMSAVASLQDIDALQHVGFPASAMKVCMAQMRKLGFEPKVTASYRVACKQGWAPPPKTEAQKAIWKQVMGDKERGPSNPMTIPPPKSAAPAAVK